MKALVYSLTLLAAVVVAAFNADAQTRKYKFVNNEWVEVTEDGTPVAVVQAREAAAEAAAIKAATLDSILNAIPQIPIVPADTTIDVDSRMLPRIAYLPTVFDSYDIKVQPDSIYSNSLLDPESSTAWVDDIVQSNNRYRRFLQRYMIDNPTNVVYNINTLPEAPKKYHVVVDPSTTSITVEEIVIDQNAVKDEVSAMEVKKKHWLHNFDGLVQFSQAYISPNWYQGGRNSLNAIMSAAWTVKLNTAFHPNLLFENTISYKLGLTDAPDDSLRQYAISEDIFQVNTKFGVKAAKRWYYSATLQFKTQLLNNYTPNTMTKTAAFLSPGELNLGLGMTYAYTNPKKTFTLNASFAPFSYNLKMCVNNELAERGIYGIPPGKHAISQYGSNIDTNLTWQIAYNINYKSRLTAFTDYSYIQSDWEHTLAFTINKYLTTQLYVHFRYDSQNNPRADGNWKKLQIKEILSFGFAYKIAPI